jgi:hypothetical protein
MDFPASGWPDSAPALAEMQLANSHVVPSGEAMEEKTR